MAEGNGMAGLAPGAPKVMVLSEQDNIAVVVLDMRAGETVEVRGQTVTLRDDVPLGHKIAIAPIAAGDRVFRIGVPIGSAFRAIAVGEHVHTHNIQSDYLNNYTEGFAHGE